MGFIQKIKLLFKIQKPAGEVISAVKEVKKTKKWFHFTGTLVGVLTTTVLALTEVIPPQLQLIISSFLQAAYNILRGAEKMESAEVKGPFRTTEFWLSSFTELQKAVVAQKTGGVTAPWLEIFTSFINVGALMLGQNLSARTPTTEETTNK